MVSASVPVAWARIEGWLRSNSIAGLSHLGQPATEQAIRLSEEVTRAHWHHDLTALYRVVDGSGTTDDGVQVFPDMTLISLDEAVQNWRRLVELRSPASRPPEERAEPQDITDWSPLFIPFAADDFGNMMFVDHRPGPAHGAVGRWENADLGRAGVWTDLVHALDAVADALRDGTPLHAARPRVDGDRTLLWE